MASYFVGSPAFLSHPLTKTHQKILQLSNSSQTPPSQPPQPPESSPSPPPSELKALGNQQQPPMPLVSAASSSSINSEDAAANGGGKKGRRTIADSTDWVASSLTRRFGLGAGLAWVGFLAVGVVSEQIKTRLEVSQEQANTRDADKQEEVILPNGIRYTDIRVGGGASPRQGDLVVIDIKGSIKDNGQAVFVETFSSDKKPLALVMGSRPYTRGMCEGIENALRTMKSGGKRKIIVPPNLAFGEDGADFGSSVQIPPNSTLEYIVEVDKVSIAPA